jgi:hypothetical protein
VIKFRQLGLSAALLIITSVGFSTPSIASQSSSTALIRVEQVGGFVGPNVLTTRLPQVVLYSDGRILASTNLDGDVRRMYEGLLSKSALLSEISLFAKVTKIPAGGWGLPPVADVPSTQITLLQKGVKKVVNVYALGFTVDSVPSSTNQARSALSKAINKLVALAGSKKYFQPTSYEVWPQAAASDPSQNSIPWPKLIVAPHDGCNKVSAKPFLMELKAAGSTPWIFPDGSVERLTWRPALPDDVACHRTS